MNAIMERWVHTCRRELLERALIWNHRHLLHALREILGTPMWPTNLHCDFRLDVQNPGAGA